MDIKKDDGYEWRFTGVYEEEANKAMALCRRF
jgi:hypothetical protein